MPIYEYQCTKCHHHVDLLQKLGAPAVTLCPECSNDTLVKLVSAAGFQLKGTGWYATDFKNKNTTTAPEKTASTTTDSTTTKTENKTTTTKGGTE